MNITFPREWDRFEHAAVIEALHSSHMGHVEKRNPLAVASDPFVAYRRIKDGEQDAMLVDGYLVVFDVGPLWSGTVPVVTELYVVATSFAHGSLRSVPKALMAVAEQQGAAGVYVGNATSDPRITRFYEAQGFVPAGTQLYKERKHGQGSE